MSDKPTPISLPGNTKPLERGITLRIAMAPLDNGTRCSFPAFMRAAGTVHKAASISISAHVAPRTSPDRQAVSIAKGGRFSRTLPDVENGHFSYEKTKKSPIVWG
jgi:hypothetical protein